MHAGDGLHLAAVAKTQSAPIDVFHLADVRVTVLGNRDVAVLAKRAGHAGGPENFVFQPVTGKFLHIEQEFQGFAGGLVRRGDEFQQRFGIIRGDVRMRQCRAKRKRVRFQRQLAVPVDAQCFAFQSFQPAVKEATGGVGEGGEVFGIDPFRMQRCWHVDLYVVSRGCSAPVFYLRNIRRANTAFIRIGMLSRTTLMRLKTELYSFS